MEKAAEALTNYFLKANLIEDGQKEWCRYMIMHRMMNVVSLLVLVPIEQYWQVGSIRSYLPWVIDFFVPEPEDIMRIRRSNV